MKNLKLQISKHYYVGALLLMSLLSLFPAIVNAQTFDASGRFTVFVVAIITFINNVLVPFIFALALLIFIYGVVQYFILGGADEGKREQGRALMLYAIIGFVLMVSVWGIVNLLATGLGFGGQNLDGGDIPSATAVNT